MDQQSWQSRLIYKIDLQENPAYDWFMVKNVSALAASISNFVLLPWQSGNWVRVQLFSEIVIKLKNNKTAYKKSLSWFLYLQFVKVLEKVDYTIPGWGLTIPALIISDL